MMDIPQLLRALRAHWLLVVILATFGGALAGAYSWLQTPLYRTSAQLFISISGGGETGAADLNQGGTFAERRVRSYANMVDSPAVTAEVINDLGLPYTTEELARSVSASSPLNTVLLNITVTDPSPERARDIANAVAVEFTHYVTELETPTGELVSPVKATVTKPALLPAAPISPNTKLNLALGIIVGLAGGGVIAALRFTLDKTIHGRRDIAAIADAAIVGEVADDSKTKKRPLIVDDPSSPRAEAFRRLRTNIRFLSIDEPIRSLVVTGSVPDEGKSTVAANLAIAIAQAGESVVLIDGDLRKASLASLFAVPGGVGLTSVLLGDVPLKDAMQQWRPDLPLHVITSGPIPPNPTELLGSRRLTETVEALLALNMVVIFDSPPLVPVTDAAVLARATQGALVVARVGFTRSDHLDTTIEALRNVDARILGVVANRVKNPENRYTYYVAQPSGWRDLKARVSARARALPRAAAARPMAEPPTMRTPPSSADGTLRLDESERSG
jgi:capsular exopolysaccharide synthesis family protein